LVTASRITFASGCDACDDTRGGSGVRRDDLSDAPPPPCTPAATSAPGVGQSTPSPCFNHTGGLFMRGTDTASLAKAAVVTTLYRCPSVDKLMGLCMWKTMGALVIRHALLPGSIIQLGLTEHTAMPGMSDPSTPVAPGTVPSRCHCGHAFPSDTPPPSLTAAACPAAPNPRRG